MNILPGRSLFCCTDPSNHARRANLAIPGCFVWELRARRGARRGEGCRRSACGSRTPPLCARRRGAFAGSSHAALSCPRSRARCSCCCARLRVRRARCSRVRCACIPRRPTRGKRIRLASLGMSRLAVHATFALRVRFAAARVVDLVGISHEAGTRISVVASATRPKQRDRVVYRRKRGAVMVFR